MMTLLAILGGFLPGQPAPAYADRPAPSVNCETAAARAEASLRSADASLTRRELRSANLALDSALQALGSAYRRPTMRDDTGMRLVLARSNERQGKTMIAARQKRRVLIERLGLCGMVRR